MTFSIGGSFARTLDYVGSRNPNAIRPRESLLGFAHNIFRGFQVGPHTKVIADALERLSNSEPGYEALIITVPPRHGKSTLATEIFPAWHLGRHPNENIIACSHTASLAQTFSRRARDLIAEPGYPFDERVSPDTSSVTEWTMDGHRGGYFAAGVGGGITGRGANILIVDDPHKNSEEAKSPRMREKVWDWYQGVAQTRLEANGRVVIIATRWHRDDLIGRAIKREGRIEDGGRWRVIHFPAQWPDGSYLWPERFSASFYEKRRASAGEYHWAAQYQGEPVPEGGSIVHDDWIGYFEYPAAYYEKIIQSWDTAFINDPGSDFSACTTWGLSVEGYDLLDVWRYQVEFPDLERAIEEQAFKWRPTEVLIEDRGSGTSVIQSLRRRTRLPIIAVPAVKSKTERLQSVSPIFEARRVRVQAGRPWTDIAVSEITSFPYAEHDDICDAAVHAIVRLSGVNPLVGQVSSQKYIGELEDDDGDDPYFARFNHRR